MTGWLAVGLIFWCAMARPAGVPEPVVAYVACGWMVITAASLYVEVRRR